LGFLITAIELMLFVLMADEHSPLGLLPVIGVESSPDPGYMSVMTTAIQQDRLQLEATIVVQALLDYSASMAPTQLHLLHL
jgi:hypothetical protein